MSDARVYRSKSTRWMAGALSFVFFLVALTGVNGLGGGAKKSSAVTWVGIALIVIASLGIVWCFAGFAQMGVSVSEKGILIRNWFRRRWIPWHEVEAFRFGNSVGELSARELLSSPVLQTYVISKSGDHYVMSGLSATRINRAESKRRVQAILDQLEIERLRHVHDS